MSLVIVDDCPLNLAILKRIASSKGARKVEIFTDPLQALGHLQSNTAAVIIVDQEMEQMDGVDLVQRLRENGANKGSPIVMDTGSEAHELRFSAVRAGVQDFLTKPIDVAQFKQVLNGRLAEGWLNPEVVAARTHASFVQDHETEIS